MADPRNPIVRGAHGVGEAALSLASGVVGDVGGGLNAITTAARGGSPAEQAAAVRATQNAVQYQPRTEYGQQIMQRLGEVMEEITAPFTEGADRLMRVADRAGVPASLTAIPLTAINVGAEVVGPKGKPKPPGRDVGARAKESPSTIRLTDEQMVRDQVDEYIEMRKMEGVDPAELAETLRGSGDPMADAIVNRIDQGRPGFFAEAAMKAADEIDTSDAARAAEAMQSMNDQANVLRDQRSMPRDEPPAGGGPPAEPPLEGDMIPRQQYPVVQIMEDANGVTVGYGAFERDYPGMNRVEAENQFRQDFADVLGTQEGRSRASQVPMSEFSEGDIIEGNAFAPPRAVTGTPPPRTTTSQADFVYGDAPARPPNSARIIDVGMELNEQARQVWGDELPDMNMPKARSQVAQAMTEEALRSYEKRPNMAGWYKDNLNQAMESAARIHPELATDKQASDAFKFIMAITSNGQEVGLNAKLTNDYYEQFKRDGKFPVAGSGKEHEAMKKSFATANSMVEDLGFDGFSEFLDREFTVKELQDLGWKVGGEKVDAKVTGSAIFGPKIGGGFMQNLRGNYDPATFDRWWTRTWGRHTGTLIEPEGKIGDQIEAFMDEVDDISDADLRTMGISRKDIEANPEEAAMMVYRQFSGGGFKDKTPLNNAARNLAKSLSNVVDAPGGGQTRENMRNVITRVRDNLRRQGIMVDTADVQALLWYTEKDLYGKMGAPANTETVDYATVWKRIADEKSPPTNVFAGSQR